MPVLLVPGTDSTGTAGTGVGMATDMVDVAV
jgi:hypothetical protein